ncbi:MAG: N-acetylmuramoyl-L-alanine amidase, partial [Ruminococcus sp.]
MIKKIISSLVAGSLMTGVVSSPVYICSADEELENFMIFDSKDYGDNIYSYSDDSPLLQADSERPALEDIPINENIIGLDESVIKVMIDPGHNAYENRSPVYSSYYESVMTWKLSNYLKEELELLGVHADLTKYSLEEKPALQTRGHKSKGYDFFISIHSNAASYSSIDRPVALCYQNLSWTTIDDTSREIGGLLANKVAEVMQTNQKGVISQRKSVQDRDGNDVW